MKKKIRWFSVFLAVSMLFMSLNVNVFAEEDTMDNQANDEPLVADYPEGVVENNIPLLSTEPTETENNNRASTAVIEDGVYAIMSYSYTYRWITIENDSPWEDANVQQEYSSSYPTTSFDRSSLFKISRVGTTDRYIIRSMVNNRMTIDLTSDGKVITKKIPAADSSVNISDTFFIETDGAGYYLRPYGYAYVINMVSTSTANLSTTLKSSATSSAKWTFVKYTGESKNGMTLYRPASWGSIGNVVGNTSNATLVGWSTHINANTLSMDIKSGYEDLGTLSWSSSTSKMTLVAENPGQIRINGRIKYANGTEVYSGYFSHMIVPQEGTYYIQNAGTEKYIDIEGPSYSSGATVQQWQFHTGNQEKWIIEHVENSGGYIRLKSVYSGHYIGVDSSNTSAIKQYNYQNNYTLWKIDRSSAGNLILICKGTESTGVVLAVPSSSTVNGKDLTQITYTNNATFNDEWCLYKIGDYTVNVSILYDNAYNNRYNDAYSRIGNQVMALQEKYMQEIGIIVNNVSLTVFSSYADTYCTTDYTDECSHVSETCRNSELYTGGSTKLYSLHHTNIYNIMLRIPFPDLSSTVKVAYIGHELCTEDNHTGHPFYGLTYKSIGLATITNFTSEASETKTFIHEFDHLYYVEDHYGGSGKTTAEIIAATGNLGYSSNCIHGENKDTLDVINDLTICDGCKATIKNNMSRFDH